MDAEVLDALKRVLAALPAEVNLVTAISEALHVLTAGGDLAAVLGALIADEAVIFPDPNTRPYAVAILQSWLLLHSAARPAAK